MVYGYLKFFIIIIIKRWFKLIPSVLTELIDLLTSVVFLWHCDAAHCDWWKLSIYNKSRNVNKNWKVELKCVNLPHEEPVKFVIKVYKKVYMIYFYTFDFSEYGPASSLNLKFRTNSLCGRLRLKSFYWSVSLCLWEPDRIWTSTEDNVPVCPYLRFSGQVMWKTSFFPPSSSSKPQPPVTAASSSPPGGFVTYLFI